MNLLKNNGWKCLWRGHPAQPTDQLKPPTLKIPFPYAVLLSGEFTPTKFEHVRHMQSILLALMAQPPLLVSKTLGLGTTRCLCSNETQSSPRDWNRPAIRKLRSG